MNRRIANKIVFSSPHYWDVWTSPNSKQFVDVPHSGKHWNIWLRACDTIGGVAHIIKENMIAQITEVVDNIIEKQKELDYGVQTE